MPFGGPTYQPLELEQRRRTLTFSFFFFFPVLFFIIYFPLLQKEKTGRTEAVQQPRLILIPFFLAPVLFEH